jgi:hypothetical protein
MWKLNEDYGVLEFDAVWLGRQVPGYWRNVLPPWSEQRMVVAHPWITLVPVCQAT